MHQHSDKIEPRKVAVTVVLLILLLIFGWYFSKDRKKDTQEVDQTTTSAQISLDKQNQ